MRKGSCSDAGRELATRHTSRAGKRLGQCVGLACSIAGWRLRVLGTSAAGTRLRKCGPFGRRDNPGRRLSEIARVVRRDWADPIPMASEALEAMANIGTIDERYADTDARSIVAAFLSSSGKWTGPVAREVKAELRDAMGIPTPKVPGEGDRACAMDGYEGKEFGALGRMVLYRCSNKRCSWEWGVVSAVKPKKRAAARPKPKSPRRAPRATT